MNIASYRSAASLSAYERWQDVTSQNIAASSMPGYKKSDVSFDSVMGDLMRLGGQGSTFRNTSQGAMPSVNVQTNFTQGELRRTGSDLDFAIQGPGFFQIQQENKEMAYTRNGEFHLNADGVVVTKEGLRVMGEGGPITANPNGGSFTINSEGTLTQGDQVIGRLPLYNTQDLNSLRHLGKVMYGAAPGQRLERVDNPVIVGGYVEGSNVSPLSEMVNLITVSRAYEACQKTMTSSDDEADKAIQILGNPQA